MYKVQETDRTAHNHNQSEDTSSQLEIPADILTNQDELTESDKLFVEEEILSEPPPKQQLVVDPAITDLTQEDYVDEQNDTNEENSVVNDLTGDDAPTNLIDVSASGDLVTIDDDSNKITDLTVEKRKRTTSKGDVIEISDEESNSSKRAKTVCGNDDEGGQIDVIISHFLDEINDELL